MNVEYIVACLKDLEGMKGDDEAAHSYEDALYKSVAESIAAGTCEDPAAVCRELLKSRDVDFARWCA